MCLYLCLCLKSPGDIWFRSVIVIARKTCFFFSFLPLITLWRTVLEAIFLLMKIQTMNLLSLCPSSSPFFFFLSTYSPPWRRRETLLMPSFSVSFSISTPWLSLYPVFCLFFLFLSFLSFVPSLSFSLCSCALPVGVKLGECHRKREAAGREMKGCRRREKRKGDNEKPDLGS